MLNHEEAQELHDLIGFALEAARGDRNGDWLGAALARALELSARLVGETHDVKTLCERAIASLPEKTYVYHIDRGDELSAEQIAWILADDMEALWESFWEWEAEQQDGAVDYYLSDTDLSSDEREALWADLHVLQDFRDEVIERDASTWFDDLIRNTPAVMIRYDTGHSVTPDSWSMNDDEIRDEMHAIAETLGIDYDANVDALRSLVIEASYGGELVILHRSDLADVMKVTGGGTVTFTDPQVLVYDGLNGSGAMEQVKGTVTLHVEADGDTMRHDAGRMSWSDDIAGIWHGACDTPAEFKSKQD